MTDTVSKLKVGQVNENQAGSIPFFKELLPFIFSILLITLGASAVYEAKTPYIENIESRLDNGEVIDINKVRKPGDLLPLMYTFDEDEDRQFAAQQLFRFIENARNNDHNELLDLIEGRSSPVNDIGKLSQIYVPDNEIRSNPGLIEFNKRLYELNPAQRPNGVRLLSNWQLNKSESSLIIKEPSTYEHLFWIYVVIFILALVAVCLCWVVKGLRPDPYLLPLVTLLTGIGLLFMLSLRDPLREQLIFPSYVFHIVIGLFLMLGASLWGHRLRLEEYYRYLAIPILALAILLKVFGSGPQGSNAKITLWFFAPAELIKILCLVFLSGFLALKWQSLRGSVEKKFRLGGFFGRINLPPWQELLTILLVACFIVAIFYFLQDFGPLLILTLLFLILYGTARKQGLAVILVILVVAVGFWLVAEYELKQRIVLRIHMMRSPWENARRNGDQIAKSFWAFASGGFYGSGPGLGDPNSIPTAQTDLILAGIAEELGFVGVFAVIAIYILFLFRCLNSALRASNYFAFFLSLGLSVLITLQFLLVSAGVLGIIPLTGVVSPFLSYGGTAMAVNFFGLGLISAISAKGGGKDEYKAFAGPVRLLKLASVLIALIILSYSSYYQIFKREDTILASALTLNADDKYEYEPNPRLPKLAQLIQRGDIYDRSGVLLATSNWNKVLENRAVYESLGFRIKETCSQKESRHYPFGSLTSYLLGNKLGGLFNEPNDFIESQFNPVLQGYDDKVTKVPVRDYQSGGLLIDHHTGTIAEVRKKDLRELLPLFYYRYDLNNKEAQLLLSRRRDVQLSIDIRLQRRVSDRLIKALEDNKKERGSAVVIDPTSGDLLASVSFPVPPDEGIPTTVAPKDILDRSRRGYFPPGSSFKIVSAIAALRRNPGVARQTFSCVLLPDNFAGIIITRDWNRIVHDDRHGQAHPHGTVDMERGLVYSCNAYFAQLVTGSVGADELLNTANLFNIKVANPNTTNQLYRTLPDAAFGQGEVVVTPFQMAKVAATIAKLGDMPNGRWLIDENNPRREGPRKVLDTDQARILARFMRLVVEKGTAKGAFEPANIANIIAGKTGTAQVSRKTDTGAYIDLPPHSWFIGFAPYNESATHKIAFSVLIENGGYGAKVAAPVAGKIVEDAIAIGLIP
jgi:cell division protein FtsI/penicillin-binding protein 2/cell division protein FtsW (lipid II flippase)